MKKYLFTYIAGMLSLFSVSMQGQYLTQNLYGIKYGTIHYKSTSSMNFPGQPPLKTGSEGIVYFDDYGKKRSNVFTETQDAAEFKITRHLQTVYTGNNKYSIDLDNKKGTGEALNDRLDKITNYDGPDEADKELFTFEFSGAGTFLNKPCRLYTVTEKQGSGSVSKVTVWKNIVLKRVTTSSILNYTFEVSKIEEAEPDSTLLSLPKDVEIENNSTGANL